MKICVVGAGVTGLYIALKLAEKNYSVTVYERSKRIGGRWKSVREAHRQSFVEAGAWRVSKKRHPKTFQLLAHCLKVDMRPINYDHEQYATTNHQSTIPDVDACAERSGLSVRDNRVLQVGKDVADTVDSESGYPGQDKGSCTVKEVYGALSKGSHTTESGKYFYPSIGFTQCILRLCLKCKQTGKVEFKLQHHVQRATEQNVVCGLKRKGLGGTEYEPFESGAHDWIVWCVPPRCLPEDDRNTNFHLLKASCMHAPLVHIYAPLPAGVSVPTFKVRSDSPICQTIHHRPKSGWWQPCYASGTHALFWYRLHQHDPAKFKKQLCKYVRWTLRSVLNDTQLTALLDQLAAARVYFWEHAIHMWEPIWFASDEERLRRSVQPNPKLRPTVLVAGEALSLNQGWTEGCLQTADIAISLITSPTGSASSVPRRNTKPFLLYRGLRVHIPEEWLDKHPGGKQAITNYYGKDVTHLWDATHKNNRKSMQHLYAFVCATDNK